MTSQKYASWFVYLCVGCQDFLQLSFTKNQDKSYWNILCQVWQQFCLYYLEVNNSQTGVFQSLQKETILPQTKWNWSQVYALEHKKHDTIISNINTYLAILTNLSNFSSHTTWDSASAVVGWTSAILPCCLSCWRFKFNCSVSWQRQRNLFLTTSNRVIFYKKEFYSNHIKPDNWLVQISKLSIVIWVTNPQQEFVCLSLLSSTSVICLFCSDWPIHNSNIFELHLIGLTNPHHSSF